MMRCRHDSTWLSRWLSLALILTLAGCADPPSGTGDRAQADDAAAEKRVAYETIGDIFRIDPALDSLIPADATIEVLAEGFEWAEGPVWISDGAYLLFSDVPTNTILRWKEGEGTHQWLSPSGYTAEAPRGGEPGSNGLLLDAAGHLVLCQHGDRRVARLDASLDDPRPTFTTLADRWQGKRLNSPNDAVLHSGGALYFTDPPYGLAAGPDDPNRETNFSGVYRVDAEGEVQLLTDALTRPNGIAFSPDEQTLYVANSDPEHAVWMAYDVLPDGTIDNDRIFFDATEWVAERPGLPDGLKVDAAGNLFATGPGGVLVLSPDGRHLGTVRTNRPTANCAFGNGGDHLYMTADDLLLRVPLVVAESE